VPEWQQLPMEKLSTVWWSSSWNGCFDASGLLGLARCARSERLGLMGEGRSASHFCLLSALGHQPIEVKGLVADRIEVNRKDRVSEKRLRTSSRTSCWGSIMLQYIWADTLNKCSFHSSHHCLYDWVMKRGGTQADRSMSDVSASG
jgi:hypothetical protein